MELQIKFISICNGNKKYNIGTPIFTRIFAFKLFNVSIAVANNVTSKYILVLVLDFKIEKFEFKGTVHLDLEEE